MWLQTCYALDFNYLPQKKKQKNTNYIFVMYQCLILAGEPEMKNEMQTYDETFDYWQERSSLNEKQQHQTTEMNEQEVKIKKFKYLVDGSFGFHRRCFWLSLTQHSHRIPIRHLFQIIVFYSFFKSKIEYKKLFAITFRNVMSSLEWWNIRKKNCVVPFIPLLVVMMNIRMCARRKSNIYTIRMCICACMFCK